MPSTASQENGAPEGPIERTSWTPGMPFISVAFVTALVFGPLVITTGLMTTRAPEAAKIRAGAAPLAMSLADLRPSLDADLPLRGSAAD